jgi:diphosphomevalonate decarboxylase
MKKATAIAPASVALIKYWGRKDEILRLPRNGSISINMSSLLTTTTVEFSSSLRQDSVVIDGEEKTGEAERVIKHLDRVRAFARSSDRANVVSKNSFPSSTGLSSSSSGFAALTVAAAAALGLKLSEKELSILARQGSGSACRSIPDGFVEWLDGNTSETSYAVSLYPPDYWAIADIVAVVSTEKKDVSSATGHTTATSSPFFAVRQKNIAAKIASLKKILAARDFTAFGELVEAEALEFHAVTMTSCPSLLYLIPDSLRMIKEVRKWRAEGLPVYFNLNTGQDVHILCEKKNVKEVEKRLKSLDFVQQIIANEPARGARLTEKHLF